MPDLEIMYLPELENFTSEMLEIISEKNDLLVGSSGSSNIFVWLSQRADWKWVEVRFVVLMSSKGQSPVSCRRVGWCPCWSCTRRDYTPLGGTRRRWWPLWAPPCWPAWCPRCWMTGLWSPCATNWSSDRPPRDKSPVTQVDRQDQETYERKPKLMTFVNV